MAKEVKDYEVTEARFIGGQHRAVGELVQMTDRAAKYYIEPHGAGLKLAAPAAVPVAGKPGAKGAAKPKASAANAEG